MGANPNKPISHNASRYGQKRFLAKANPTRTPLTETNTPRIETGWRRNEINGKVGQGGEIKRYTIDTAHYGEACKLEPDFFVKKYFIRKGDDPKIGLFKIPYEEDAIAYIAVPGEDLVNDDDPPEDVIGTFEHSWLIFGRLSPVLAFRTCSEGKTTTSSYAATNYGAKRCGLATILSYLCYREKEVEPSIMGAGLGYDFGVELRTKTPPNKLAARILKLKAERKCQRVIKIHTAAFPSAGGRAYVNAGMDAGYQYMMTFNKNNLLQKISVVRTATLAQEFQENPVHMNDSGEVVDPVLDPFIARYGYYWYLCKRKD